MDTDCHVWCRDPAISSMDQTHEACAKQEPKKTAKHITNVERGRPRGTRQSDNRQRTGATDRSTWPQRIDARIVARSLPRQGHYRYTCVSQKEDTYKKMRSG